MTIVERVAKNVDHAAVQRIQQDEAARATAERIAALRHIVFRNAASNRNVQALTSETAAARLLTSAGNSADGFLVLGILRVAIDKRWHSVVLPCIRYFGEHPVAARIQELWNLTTDRETV